MAPPAKGAKKLKKLDREYENIKRTLSTKARQKRKDVESGKLTPQFEMYVDSNRTAVVDQGADLKSAMMSSGVGRLNRGSKIGDPNDKFYIMQSEYMIKTGNVAMALHFVKQALEYNEQNIDGLVLLAKCHLHRLDWDSALKTSKEALNFNKNDVRAMLVKGEALFNICQFEHALVCFSRAQALSREREIVESCRFGVQKCRQIIMDSIPQNGEMFRHQGIDAFFRKLRRKSEALQYGLFYDPL